MRINAHAHIFNLRSIFTPETMHILLNRLKMEGMPELLISVLYEKLAGYLRHEISAETILGAIDEKQGITDELKEIFEKLSNDYVTIELQIDGLIPKLGKAVTDVLRKKILELYDLDENGEIKQNIFDYLEYVRIALLPTIEKVTDEVMGQMGKDDGLVALSMDITDGSDDGKLFAKQLCGMSDAVLAYPGRIFPFVMVNPIRDAHYTIMTDALEKRGFWGVKLYPSLGYPVVSDKMFAVYEYCQSRNIPLLSHCTDKGFRKTEESGELASPDKWEKVFLEFPDLKICFGHFGANDAIIHESIANDTWTAMIINWMKQYPNVFADISFHTDPMIGNKGKGVDKDTAKQNYIRNIKKLLKSLPTRDRLLFGTDYWMVRTVTKDIDYWSFYEKLFTPAQFSRLAQTNPIELSVTKVKQPFFPVHSSSYIHQEKMYCS